MSTKQPKTSPPPVRATTSKVPTTGAGGMGAAAAGASVLNNQMILGIVIAVIVVLLTIVYLLSRGKKKGRTVLLVGPSDGGKTSIFVQLWQNKVVETVTSVIPNEGEYSPSNGRPILQLKDLPGNDRLRKKFWDSNKTGVRGIICVIHAAGGSKAIRDTSDVLYNVLTDPAVTSLKPNVMIFANKQDLATAKGVKVIKSLLEREMTTLRLTKSASLQTTGGSAQSTKFLGKPDQDFEFEHLTNMKIEFAEGTGNVDADGLKPVYTWLDSIA